MGYSYYFHTLFFFLLLIMLAMTLYNRGLLSNHACLAWMTLQNCTIQAILRFSIVYIIFWLLRLCYTKTTCSHSFKLSAFNNYTLRSLHINYLKNWTSFKVAINFLILIKQFHSCVLSSCKNMIHLEFFKNINFKWSNNWFLYIKHHSCVSFYITMLLFWLAMPCWWG